LLLVVAPYESLVLVNPYIAR